MNLKTEDISLKSINDTGLCNIFIKNQPFSMTLRNGNIPFGIEEVFYDKKKKYILKIEITKELSDFFKYFEKLLGQCIKLNETYLQTQIIKSKRNFKDKLLTKIKTINDKFQVNCIKNNKEISIYEIVKEKNLTITLVPVIYYDDEKYIVKWNVVKITI